MKHCLDKNESQLFDLINLSNWNGLSCSLDTKQSQHSLLIYKKSKMTVKIQISRILLLFFIGAVSKILYVKLKLRFINLTKALFLLDVNLGNEVYIPDQLSQSVLPHSFRYYDFLLMFIKENISNNLREKVLFKCSLTNQIDKSD